MINKSLWFCSSLLNNEVTKDKNEECYKIKCKLACVHNDGEINEVELVLFHFQITILTCVIAKPTKHQPGLAGGGFSRPCPCTEHVHFTPKKCLLNNWECSVYFHLCYYNFITIAIKNIKSNHVRKRKM